MAVKKFLDHAKELEEGVHKKNEEHHAEAEEGESWLISYADMMTLLCGFFVMMFSMAKMDDPAFEKVKESVAKKFGGDYKSPTDDLARFVTQMINDVSLEKEALIQSDPFGVSVAFHSTLFFDNLGADIKPEGKEVLKKLIDTVAERQDREMKQYRIVVEGHTDSRPITGGNYPSNWELSAARASRVVRMFLDSGFEPKKLTAIGYASTHPEALERTPAGTWNEDALSKNRRVVVRILEPKVDSIPLPATPATSAH